MSDDTPTVYDLIDIIQHTLNGFAADLAGSGPGDVFAAEQEVAEVRRHVAALEAENARLRAEVDDLRERLVEHGLPTCAWEDALAVLGRSGAVLGWARDEQGMLEVHVRAGAEREVLATMAAAGLQPEGAHVPDNTCTVIVFRTAAGGEA